MVKGNIRQITSNAIIMSLITEVQYVINAKKHLDKSSYFFTLVKKNYIFGRIYM